MEEKELISKLATLKQIKPRNEWVVLAKSQILNTSPVRAKEYVFENKITPKGTLANIFRASFQPRYAYALAVLLVATIGVFGLSGTIFKHTVSEAPVDPKVLSELRTSVETFKEKSKNLSDMARYQEKNIPLAVEEVTAAAKEITQTLKEEPRLAKEVALEINNNKTLLSVETVNGASTETTGKLHQTLDDLYKALDSPLIQELEKLPLTDSQKESLNIIKELYGKENYSGAMESILLLNVSMEENKVKDSQDDKKEQPQEEVIDQDQENNKETQTIPLKIEE